ncbi:ACT domain-containing protein [Cellulomonas gilvus]|uniref:ACT domain-containing protein n=1 Tax=Cellulomonas gilvus TaxID=11 RepID=UPI0002EDE4F3|nr:ACT domain-containing protein [Cellulomonas gilvus]
MTPDRTTTAPDERWVTFVRGTNRPGTVAAVTAVFATRGISFDSLATGDADDEVGLVVVTFRTTERRQRELVRAVDRLAAVSGVVVRRAEDLGVRAAGVVHVPRGVAFRPPEEAAVSWSGDAAQGQPVLVEGPLVDVELVVDAARAAGATSSAIVIQPPERVTG